MIKRQDGPQDPQGATSFSRPVASLPVDPAAHWRKKLKGLTKAQARLMRERHTNFQDWCSLKLHYAKAK